MDASQGFQNWDSSLDHLNWNTIWAVKFGKFFNKHIRIRISILYVSGTLSKLTLILKTTLNVLVCTLQMKKMGVKTACSWFHGSKAHGPPTLQPRGETCFPSWRSEFSVFGVCVCMCRRERRPVAFCTRVCCVSVSMGTCISWFRYPWTAILLSFHFEFALGYSLFQLKFKKQKTKQNIVPKNTVIWALFLFKKDGLWSRGSDSQGSFSGFLCRCLPLLT